jgi:hypothetical protein
MVMSIRYHVFGTFGAVRIKWFSTNCQAEAKAKLAELQEEYPDRMFQFGKTISLR